MIKTNLGLVEHCHMALNEGFGYVWGCFGQVLTPALLIQKLKQYPSGVGNYETFIRQNWLNKRSVDCIGLIKSYLWWNNGNVKYNPSQDKNADGMFAIAKEKGPINTIPEIPGVLVWRKGHIGVYIGNGEVIEARGTKYGVKKYKLKDRTFTHWLECPYINYIREEVIIKPNKPLSTDKVRVSILGDVKTLDGYKKDGTNYILIDNVYIPIRSVFEALGYKVGWENNTVVVSK